MRKSKRKFRFLWFFIFLIGSLAAVMMFSPLLLLSDFHMEYSGHYTAEDIIRISGLEKGQHAFRYVGGSLQHLLHFRSGKAERNIQNLPWVKTVKVKVHFPNAAHITITDRHAVAWIRQMGNYLLVDEEGYVLEVSSELDDQFPEIRGVHLDKFAIGKKIGTDAPEKIEWLVQLLFSLDQVDLMNPHNKLIQVIDWIDFSEKKELYLSLDGRVTAKMKIDHDLTNRLSYLKELYYNYIRPGEKGFIDFFDEKFARFIVE